MASSRMVTQSYSAPDRGASGDGGPDEALVELRSAIERRDFAAASRARRALIRTSRVILPLVTPASRAWGREGER